MPPSHFIPTFTSASLLLLEHQTTGLQSYMLSRLWTRSTGIKRRRIREVLAAKLNLYRVQHCCAVIHHLHLSALGRARTASMSAEQRTRCLKSKARLRRNASCRFHPSNNRYSSTIHQYGFQNYWSAFLAQRIAIPGMESSASLQALWRFVISEKSRDTVQQKSISRNRRAAIRSVPQS